MDRRSARTRAKLEEALFGLLSERSYQAVTVDEVCRRAGVGRSTFYTHFSQKDDLKRSPLAALQRRLSSARPAENERRFAFSLPMLEHAKQNLPLYRSLVSTGSTEATFPAMYEMLARRVEEECASWTFNGPLAAIPRKHVTRAVVSTFFALMLAWLDDGAIQPEANVDAAFHSMLQLA